MSFRDPISFEAIGTKWWISIGNGDWSNKLLLEIDQTCTTFNQRFSRFIQDSELSVLNRRLSQQSSATERISTELFAMLEFAQLAHEVSGGAFDPNISTLLRGYGYDEHYSFQLNDQLLKAPRGKWWLEKPNLLHTEGLVEIDSGGFGKGVLIDRLSALLRRHNHHSFLIDGGGDMFATTKPDGQPWSVALQHPYEPDSALGTISLENCGFAASASTHRKVGAFHHLLNVQTRKPVEEIVAVFCTGPTAEAADVAATALFVSKPEFWPQISSKLQVEYCILNPQLEPTISDHFSGKLFSSSE